VSDPGYALSGVQSEKLNRQKIDRVVVVVTVQMISKAQEISGRIRRV
jgi:hypothetical protein